MVRAVLDTTGDPRVPRARLRPLRPPRRHPVRHARHECRVRRGSVALARAHRPGRRRFRAVRGDGDRLPLVREHSRHRRPRHVRRRRVPHRSVAARARRLHRPTGGRHRHGVVGRPGDPCDRRAGRRAVRVPTDRELHDAVEQRAARSRRGSAGQGRLCRAPGAEPAHACCARGALGGQHRLGARGRRRDSASRHSRRDGNREASRSSAAIRTYCSPTRRTSTPPTSPAPRSGRWCTTPRSRSCSRRRSSWAASDRASTAATTRRSTSRTFTSST